MDFEWTRGMIIFVSGIGGCVVSISLFAILSGVYSRKRKKLVKRIEEEY